MPDETFNIFLSFIYTNMCKKKFKLIINNDPPTYFSDR